MKICVVIPVYNESTAIGNLVHAVRAKNLDVLVIDDGSQDASGDLARKAGATVISHPQKCGKGFSLRDGFHYALSHGYDGVIAMDGDGQHVVEDLDPIIVKAKEYPHCLISGNRMANPKGMPLVRYCVNRIMSFAISKKCRQHVPDSQCGFRYIGAHVLKEMNLTSSDFEIESEMLIEASRAGFKIYSVPIQTIYCDEISKIHPVIDTVRFFKYLFRQARSPKR